MPRRSSKAAAPTTVEQALGFAIDKLSNEVDRDFDGAYEDASEREREAKKYEDAIVVLRHHLLHVQCLV